MNRRDFLSAVSLTTGATLAGVAFSNLSEAIAAEQPIWGYTGKEGPDSWGALSPEYNACQSGFQQSPIDLKSATDAELASLQVKYKDIPLKILNNGHTIQVNAKPGNTLRLNDTTFELLQFHFHDPSEHTVKGDAYPMELHLVHKSSEGRLTVIGIFLQQGQENEVLKPVWDAMPTEEQPETQVRGSKVAISQLIPKNQATYRYFGSLTTPPCSEIVQWVVFEEPIEVSQAQIQQFKQLFPGNARPTQPLNRRFLLDSV